MTSKYTRKITKVPTSGTGDSPVTVELDVYDVLAAWEVTNPAIQHAVKKLLMPGARGAKSKVQDIEEVLASIKRALELEGLVGKIGEPGIYGKLPSYDAQCDANAANDLRQILGKLESPGTYTCYEKRHIGALKYAINRLEGGADDAKR